MLTISHIAKAAAALHATGQHTLAIEFWDEAVTASPNDPALLTGAAVTLRALKEPQKAEAEIRRAFEIEPTARRAVLLACALHDQFRFHDAEVAIREAYRLDPDSPDANGLLGIWLLERWHYRDTTDDPLHEAIDRLDRAIELAPKNLDFAVSRVSALIAADRLEEVVEISSRLIEQYPACPEFRVHHAAARMKLGRLVSGYQEFGEWAYRLDRVGWHRFNQYPKWSWESKGTDVYVWNLEGAGDHFQFIRYTKAMADEGWTVHAIANPTMSRLLARVPGVASVVPDDGEIPGGALLASMPSLPAAYMGSVPLWTGPYMSADPRKKAQWRQRLRGVRGLRVGLAWAGNPMQANDERRSFDPSFFAPLVNVPDASFVSLQHGQCDDFGRTGIPAYDLGDHYQAGDWFETAAVIANLDLVIAPCTAIAHLAGAMGKPVWLALSEPGCWRWMRDRTDSPWYPSMQIFRQTTRGSWDGVFEAMAEQLRVMAQTKAA
jgi:tetratricopeptide (TPR) repeat protein